MFCLQYCSQYVKIFVASTIIIGDKQKFSPVFVSYPLRFV